MDGPTAAEGLRDGWHALERADWSSARSAFAAVLARGDAVEARDGLAQALWFLGDVAEAIALRERAFEDFVDAGRCDDAARVAVWVAHQHMIAGRTSAGRGWLARCERALDGVPPCAGLGWISVERARQAHDVQEQIAHATRAVEAARAFGHGDLEVYAVSLLGGAMVSAGRLEEGMRLLEEAMAAAAAGRVRDVHTLGSAYCNLVVACTDAGEWERATEWCELVETFARTNEAAPLLGACRTVHADVLMANGHWDEAEHALESAVATNARYIPEMNAPAIASLAELRVLQGRLPEAEELLAGREEHPATLRALALLRLADDRPRQAVSLLERGLRGSGDSAVASTALLTPLVDARLALGDVAGARAAADELGRFAESSGIRLLGARAAFARSLVALAAGERAEALEAARQALAAFRSLLMPLDAGLARLALARAISEDDPESAREEARAALAVFRELGAARAGDAAAALLRQWGVAQGGRPRTVGDLTGRGREVLGLIGRGMSNGAIARALVISERTAGHHVSRILMKLGVRNRAEAAAYAARARATSGSPEASGA
jgi:DNA-binding NarL/FixJ family response regulator